MFHYVKSTCTKYLCNDDFKACTKYSHKVVVKVLSLNTARQTNIRYFMGRGVVQKNFQESKKRPENTALVNTVPSKNRNSRKDMIPQLLLPRGNPLKEGMNYMPDGGVHTLSGAPDQVMRGFLNAGAQPRLAQARGGGGGRMGCGRIEWAFHKDNPQSQGENLEFGHFTRTTPGRRGCLRRVFLPGHWALVMQLSPCLTKPGAHWQPMTHCWVQKADLPVQVSWQAVPQVVKIWLLGQEGVGWATAVPLKEKNTRIVSFLKQW